MIFLHESWADEQYRKQGGAVEPPPPDTPWYKAAGMGLVRGAGDVMGAGVLATGGIVGLMEGGLFEPHASDKVFKFYEDEVQPRKDYWTPDPQTVSGTGRLLGAISSVGFPLMLGPGAAPALIGSSTFSTAADLLESGVDPATATGVGIMSGIATGVAVSLPAAGKTFNQTLGLIASNPVLGGVQAAAQGEVLKAKGYTQQAKSFDPYDPEARAIDLALGVVFGGMSHYGRERATMPVQVEDAIDTAALAQKTAKNNPLNGAKNVMVHNEASNKAVDDILEGKPVDVSQVLKDVKPEEIKAAVVPDPEAARLRETVAKEVGRVTQDIYEDDLRSRGFTVTETGSARLIDTLSESKIDKATRIITEYPELKSQNLFASENTTVDEAKKIGKEYYATLEAEPLKSPAFSGEQVFFTKKGWEYIAESGVKERTEKNAIRRVKLLPKAKEIIENISFVDEVKEAGSNKRYSLLGRFDDGSVVRVIVEEAQTDGRTFLSVFDLEDVSKKLRKATLPGRTQESAVSGVGKEPTAESSASKNNIPPSAGEVKVADTATKTAKASSQADISLAPKTSVNASVEGTAGAKNIPNDSIEVAIKTAAEVYFADQKSLDKLRAFNRAVMEHPGASNFDDYARLWDRHYKEASGGSEPEFKSKPLLDNDPIETTGERILADNPDITYHAGTDETGEPVIRTAREVVDEARAEVQKAESVKDLFDMAVDCLRRG